MFRARNVLRAVAALVLVGAGIVVGPSATAAGDVFRVYLSPTGSDTNNGRTETTAVVTLNRVQQILAAAKPATDVEVRIKQGTYTAPPNGDWTFYVPGKTVSFLPVNYQPGGAPVQRPVFRNKAKSNGTYPGGYWLHPRLPADPANPLYGGGTSGLRFYYLQVERYSTGGLSIDGDTGRDTTDDSYHPPVRKPGSKGLNGNTIVGMRFAKVGNKWARGAKAGYGAIVLTNSSHNSIEHNEFANVENSDSPGKIHGLYITHFSSSNVMNNNAFSYNSGDAVKIRDRSNFNVVEHNRFTRSGSHSYYRDEYCDTSCAKQNKMPRQCASYHNRFFHNTLISDYGGRKGHAWSLSPDGLTNAGGKPCSIPAGDQRLRTGGNT